MRYYFRRNGKRAPLPGLPGCSEFMGAYTASKWGLEGLVSSLQMELEGTGVRASVVRPGSTWSKPIDC